MIQPQQVGYPPIGVVATIGPEHVGVVPRQLPEPVPVARLFG